MCSYIFEAIEMQKEYPAKVFITSIEKSDFHWHYEYELILVLKGDLYVGIRPEPVVLQEGDIMLVNTRDVHELQKYTRDNVCLFIQIHHSVFQDYKGENRSYAFYLNSKGSECRLTEEVYHKFRSLAAGLGLAAMEKNISGYCRTKAYLYMIAAELFGSVTYDIRQFSTEKREKEDMQILSRIISYLQDNYQDGNVGDDVCREVGMSEKTMHRFLKNAIGMSVKEMVLNNKMNQSRHLLKTTDKPVGVIADICGFESENSFYRIFKQKTGMTPNEYRRRGMKVQVDQKVQGYLSYNNIEAVKLLQNYAKGE